MKKTARKHKSRKVVRKKHYSFHPIHGVFVGLALALTIGLLFISNKPFSSLQSEAASPKALFGISHRPERPVCGLPGNAHARCNSHVITNSTGTPATTSSPYIGAYGPTQFHVGYNLPCTPGGATQSLCATPVTFGPQTIAIVDAYNDPTIANDLSVYSRQFSLPDCTQANGCLQILNQNGGTTLPSNDSNWALETSMDVEIAHAMCQTCKIMLIEANSNGMNDLGTAVNTATNLGAIAISNSYGGSEFSTEANYNSYYSHPNVAVTVSTGDNGFGTEFPSTAPGVVAVGGTSLSLYSDSTYASESVWNYAGSGCSLYETANGWQTGLSNWASTNCGTKRAAADVAADADPNTGAAVYDSTPYNGQAGWFQVGGTSLSAPLIASVYALTGSNSVTNPASLLYSNFNATNSHDVTSGTNGACATIMCQANVGYDGPTGLGTPNGVKGFMTITATPTSVPPTATLVPTKIVNSPTPTLVKPSPTPRLRGHKK